MPSPARPFLTERDYRIILETLNAAPTPDNKSARDEITGYLRARALWTADARNRKLDNPW